MLGEIYHRRSAAGELARDPAQESALRHLDAFITRWKKPKSRPVFFKRRKPAPVKGVYIYGGVGRGKTMLMDMLVECLSSQRVRRVHFHAFMLEIHSRLKVLRDQAWTDDFLSSVASDIAAEADVLAFDELHVNDIADAMILGGLFAALFRKGVSVIATSNYKPDDLYKDGLQRARFLPFVDLLKKHMDVVHLDSPIDYRLRALSEKGTWFHPLDDASRKAMLALFETLTDHAPTPATSIEISGRELPIHQASAHSAWLTFNTLCREPRGASDYLALGHSFENIFVDAVPRMDEDQRNEVRRFMTLVDTLYDLGRVLVVRADGTPAQLYDGHSLAFEFQRTISRLLEMQSPDWFIRAKDRK